MSVRAPPALRAARRFVAGGWGERACEGRREERENERECERKPEGECMYVRVCVYVCVCMCVCVRAREGTL